MVARQVLKASFLIGVLSGLGCSGWAQTELNLLDFTHQWRYYQAGNAPPGDWKAPDYDDSGWASGPGALGYPSNENLLGYAPVQTLLDRYGPDGINQIITYYFRTRFEYPTNLTPGTSLVLSNLVDDGCVIYLNGAELTRIAMPAGTPAYATLASRADEISEHGLEVVTVTPTNLVRGVNTLAVEVHQGSPYSSDLIWAMALKAVICSKPQIIGCPPDLTLEEGWPLSVQMTVNSGGCTPTYQWYQGVPGNAVLVAGQTTNRLYYASASTAHSGSYFLVASNVVGAVTSCVVNVQVVPDTFPPGIVWATARDTGSSNSIEVLFTKPLLRATATNLANYIITLLGTTNQVAVSNAQQLQDTVTLRVGGGNWMWGSNYVLTVRGVCDTRTNCLTCCSNQIRIAFLQDLVPYEGLSKSFNARWAREHLGTNYVFWDQSWTLPDYDDSDPNLWPSGDGGAYYWASDPVSRPCAPLRTQMIWCDPAVRTYYFQTKFMAPSNVTRGTLDLYYMVDDGAVFYLNGVELARINMPAGSITPFSPALTPVNALCWAITNALVRNLRLGTNVLAAEVHQVAVEPHFDVYYGVKIRGVFHEPLNLPILTLTRTDSAGLPTNTVSTTQVELRWDAPHSPGWHLYMATNVTGPWTLVGTGSPFRTNVTAGAACFFTLRQSP
jgi:hypothetical protein